MKKAAIVAGALALVTAGAQAQSSVQLMGTADLYAGSIRMAGDAASKTTVGSGGMTTSWWGMKGSEDLGGGLKANVAFTSFTRMNTGTSGRFANDPLFSRDANVGLSGSFGSIQAGRGMAPNFLPTVIFNPFGDSFTFSPLVLHANVPLFNGTNWAATTPSDTGWASEIIYTTPNINGLTANLHYQIGEVAGASGKKNIGVNALYFNGPLALTGFYERDQITNPGSQVLFAGGATRTDWMLGGTYDARVVKGFLTYGQAKNDVTTVKTKTTTLGASVPVADTLGKVLVSYATTKVVGGNKRDTFTLGYDYNLSKRTDVYANVMSDKITNFSSGTSYGVGIRHRF
jgi:predicted porin